MSTPLTRGTLLDVLAQQSGWYQVRCGGNVGWVVDAGKQRLLMDKVP